MLAAKQVFARALQMVRIVLVVAVVAGSLTVARSASAQGTSGTLPNPISTKELSEYADRLNLSDQQRAALADMHDQYKAEFKILREKEIADFLKDMRKMQGVMPKRDEIRTFVEDMDRLQGKISAIDNRLFDQVQTVLTPEQQSKMPRIRQARQRTRYSASQMMMMSGAPLVDLSGIFFDLELPPDQVAQVDPMVSQYESKLTSSMGKLYESSGNMILEMFEALEKAGFGDVDVNDPQVQVKIMESMQKIWQELMQKALEQSMEIHALNRRTAKSIAAALAPEHARALLQRFYRQAYPELGFVAAGNGETIRAALKLEDLTPEQRLQIEAAQVEYHAKMDRLTEDTADVVDESRRNFSPWSMGSEEGNERQKTIAAAGQKASDINAATVTALSQTLSQEQLKLAQSNGMKSMQKAFASANQHVIVASSAELETGIEDDEWETDDDAKVADETVSMGGQAWSGDMFLPNQISHRDLEEYADRLNLQAEQRDLLNELHKAYAERYQAVKDGEFKALAELVQSMWKYDEQTQTMSGPTGDTIAKSYETRAAAMQKIREADDALFDDMNAALATPDNQATLNRLRLARERQRYVFNTGWMWGAGGANESGVELSTLVGRLGPESVKSVDSLVSEYEQAATPLFAARYQAALEMQRAQEQWQATMYAAQRSEGGVAQAMGQFREIMGSTSAAAAQANAKLAELNRATIEKIVASLPVDQAEDFRDQYNKLAFPNIYNDGSALHKRLNTAMRLETTTPEQRQKLQDVAAEYRPAYAQLSEQMVEASSGSEGLNIFSGDQEDVQKWQLREETMERLRFERNELSSRAAQKLKTILNTEQLAQIGGLPTTPE